MLSGKLKSKPRLEQSYLFSGIGTHWQISVYDKIALSELHEIGRRVEKRVEAFDKVYSRFRTGSLVSAIARKAGTYNLPEDAAPLFEMYYRLYQLTNGAFTPLVGHTLAAAGYDAHYSFQPSLPLAPAPDWMEAMDYSSGKITARQPLLLDFGAAGKGYLVDLVEQLLRSLGIRNYCIDAGGDIVYRHDTRPATIGLEDPEDSKKVLGTLSIQRGSICGSAHNRRRWQGYSHIMNAYSGEAAEATQATWVTADTALVADALATALFFTDAGVLRQNFEFEYVRINSRYGAEVSAGFEGKLYTL